MYATRGGDVVGGTFDADNYAITYSDGSLTVNPASLSMVASDTSKLHGQTAAFNGTEFTLLVCKLMRTLAVSLCLALVL